MESGASDLLEAVFASSPDAIVIVDDSGRIELASQAVKQLFGYPPNEIIGQPMELLLPETVRDLHRGHRRGFAKEPTARAMGAGLDLHGRRCDGTVVPVDVSLSPVRVEGRLLTAAFVRDATERRRSEDLMRNINDVTREVLGGADRIDVLTLICERANRLVDAAVAWVVLPAGAAGKGQLRVEAVAGRGVEGLLGATLDLEVSLSGQAMGGGSAVIVSDMHADPSVVLPAREAGLGPGVYFPLATQDGPIGALVVARLAAAPMFLPTEIAAAEVFAAAAAVGLALGDARRALEDLRLVTEHERIARDLHDTVIQRLFALGMGLQGAQRLADPSVSERIGDAVRAIDEVIREIRETIFDLNRPAGGGPDVRQQVRAVAADLADVLGFGPRLSFRGPVEGFVSDDILPELLSVLREALSNVSRHARASRADVVVVATSGHVTLTVADDGVGVPEGLTAGQGLPNMTARAVQLGGDCSVTSRRPTGTLVQWRVPTTSGIV